MLSRRRTPYSSSAFNEGLTHFFVYTADAYTYKSGATFLANQLAWLKADLAAVDRAVTPWVVGLCHKNFFMELDAYADFNPVIMQNKVDVIFTGHWFVGND